MQTTKHTLVVASSFSKYAPCVEYVFKLFARTHGYTCHFITSDTASIPAGDVFISYQTPAATHSNFAAMPAVTIQAGQFFAEGSDHTFGEPQPPAAFAQLVAEAKGTAFDVSAQREPGKATVPHDVIAASFYLLSGYHDWASAQRDPHGRVLAAHITVPQETWDTPVVNHWFRQLDELILSVLRGETTAPSRPAAPSTQQTICLTHDVDLLRKYRLGRMTKRVVKALAEPSTLGKAMSDLRLAASSSARDPYDSFDALYMVKERVSAPSTFFFLGCGPTPNNGDYRPDDRDVRELYTRARTFGDEIGLHGSWDSINDCMRLAAEKSAVESAARITINGSRQHYLRFATPETWNCVAGAGLRYEATGGFPDRSGFKYGWSGCFQPFDLDAMVPLPLLEIPLVCMDVTLANYEKIPAELALERLTNLLDGACDYLPGGAFTFLWHNITADRDQYPGYWDTFEYFFSVASGCSRFITLSQLCDEYGELF